MPAISRTIAARRQGESPPSIPGDTQNAARTLETHAYARAALHISRVAIHAGASAGLDTNLVHIGEVNVSKPATGFGMNVESGVEVAATP